MLFRSVPDKPAIPLGEEEHEVVLLLVDQVMVVPALYATDEGAAEMLMVGANTPDGLDGGGSPAGLESEAVPPHADSTSRLDSIMIDIFLHRLKFTNFMISPSFFAPSRHCVGGYSFTL